MDNKNVSIFNYWHSHYGGIITAYALEQLIIDLQNNCKLVDNMSNWESVIQKKSFNKKFADEYLNVTPNITNTYTLEDIEEKADIFITGSDQVFRLKYISRIIEQYLLTFTDSNKKRIAFSASFGVEKEQFLNESTENDLEIMKEALSAFDYISVREKSGVEICKDVFGIDAEWIIDPVFILKKDKYKKLAEKSTKNYSDKIVSYMLRPKSNYVNAYKYLSKKYNTKVEKTAYANITVEDWFNSIINCKFLITDSFHGVCFAIIFNKPFICIVDKNHGRTRIDSILEMLNIENHSIENINDVCIKECIFKPDYEKVNNKIEQEATKGMNALVNALNKPLMNDNEKVKTRIKYLKCKLRNIEKRNNIASQFKHFIWEKWLIIYHCYLPKQVENFIRFLWNKRRTK